MLSKNTIDNILDTASLRGADFAEVFDENTLFQETEASPDGIGQSQAGRKVVLESVFSRIKTVITDIPMIALRKR